MIRAWIHITAALSVVAITAACSGSSSDATKQLSDDALPGMTIQSATSEDTGDPDPTGTYIYKNRDGKTELVVSSSSWYATTTIKSGFGDDYDASQAMTSTGVVNGEELYDPSGYVKVGRLWRNANKRWAADLDAGGGTMVLFKE